MRDGRFEVRSGESEALDVDAAVHCVGGLTTAAASDDVDESSVRCRSCVHTAATGMLYDGFDAVGLQYGPGYRTLTHAWGASCERMRPTPVAWDTMSLRRRAR